jgi:hypothetical protein
MPPRMLLVGLGALLVLCGLVLIAVQIIRAGPMSRAGRTAADVTLEPQGRSGLFDLKAQAPGIGLLALGTILLIAGAVL